jgi:hypothetical protein
MDGFIEPRFHARSSSARAYRQTGNFIPGSPNSSGADLIISLDMSQLQCIGLECFVILG